MEQELKQEWKWVVNLMKKGFVKKQFVEMDLNELI